MRKLKDVPPFKRPTSPLLPAEVEARMKSKIYMRVTFGSPADLMIKNVRKALRNNEPLNREELLKLLDGLERILAGSTANDAFGFWPGKGRPRDDQFRMRDQAISYEVAELRKYGMRLESALELVAQRYKKSESVINKIYQAQARLERSCT
jgi:hypothetical protein